MNTNKPLEHLLYLLENKKVADIKCAKEFNFVVDYYALNELQSLFLIDDYAAWVDCNNIIGAKWLTESQSNISHSFVSKLQMVFRALTAHMENWKCEFSVYCSEEDLLLYKEAITFHVGGTVKVTEIVKPHTAKRFLLETTGYYKNVGA